METLGMILIGCGFGAMIVFTIHRWRANDGPAMSWLNVGALACLLGAAVVWGIWGPGLLLATGSTLVGSAIAMIPLAIRRGRTTGRVAYVIGLIGSLVVAWARGDWWLFATVALMLPVILGVRTIFRRVVDRRQAANGAGE